MNTCSIWRWEYTYVYTNCSKITKKELIACILLCWPGQTTKQQSEKEVIKLFWEVVVEMGIMWTSNKGVSLPMPFLVLVKEFLQLGITQGEAHRRCSLLTLHSLCPQQVWRAHECGPSTLLPSQLTPWFWIWLAVGTVPWYLCDVKVLCNQ